MPRPALAACAGAAALLLLLALAASGREGRQGGPPRARFLSDPPSTAEAPAATRRMDAPIFAEANSTEDPAVAGVRMCSNPCYRSLGFLDDDCACSTHGTWYMWVCNAWHGTPTKPQFCDARDCRGCAAVGVPPAAPGPVPSPPATPPAPVSPARPVNPPCPNGQPAADDWGDCRWSRCCATTGFSCYEKDQFYAQCRQTCTPGIHSDDSLLYQTPWSCTLRDDKNTGPPPSVPPAPAPKPASLPPYSPINKALLAPSSAESLTFYVYRAQNDEDYPPENQNLGNLAGVMWYLHNEIVNNRYERRYGKTRIQRFKITTKATQPLIAANMNFGVRYAFDGGQCTGPFNCTKAWEHYGYFVGCNRVNEFPTSQWDGLMFYPNAIWYSLPGKCNSRRFFEHDPACESQEPGGACISPTGTGNCTYSYEEAGSVTIDAVEGIPSFKSFAASGGWEYNNKTDRGVGMTFWDNKYDAKACQARIDVAAQRFAEKYPSMPADSDLPGPPCDFDYNAFYSEVEHY